MSQLKMNVYRNPGDLRTTIGAYIPTKTFPNLPTLNSKRQDDGQLWKQALSELSVFHKYDLCYRGCDDAPEGLLIAYLISEFYQEFFDALFPDGPLAIELNLTWRGPEDGWEISDFCITETINGIEVYRQLDDSIQARKHLAYVLSGKFDPKVGYWQFNPDPAKCRWYIRPFEGFKDEAESALNHHIVSAAAFTYAAKRDKSAEPAVEVSDLLDFSKDIVKVSGDKEGWFISKDNMVIPTLLGFMVVMPTIIACVITAFIHVVFVGS